MTRFRSHGTEILLFAALAFALTPTATADDAAPRTKVPPASRDDPLPSGAVARLGTTRFRFPHRGQLLGVVTGTSEAVIFEAPRYLCFINLESGQVRRRPLGARHHFWREQATLSGNGRRLASHDDGVVVLDVMTGNKVGHVADTEIYIRENNGISLENFLCRLSHDGRLVAVSGQRYKGSILLCWCDTTTGKRLHRVQSARDGSFNGLAFSCDGSLLAVNETNERKKGSRIRVWNTATGKEIHNYSVNPVQDVMFLPDGKAIVALAGDRSSIYLFENAGGKVIRRFRVPQGIERLWSSPNLESFALSPDGRTLVALASRSIYQWDVASGKVVRVLQLRWLHETPSLTFTPNGAQLIVAESRHFTLWDLATGKEIHPTAGHTDSVGFLEFSSDGQYLLSTAEDGTTRLWHVASRGEKHSFACEGRESVPIWGIPRAMWGFPREQSSHGLGLYGCFSPDGKRVASLWPNSFVKIWDPQTGRGQSTWCKNMETQSLAFSPDGRFLATGCSDGRVYLWAAATGKQAKTFLWDVGLQDSTRRTLASVAFSPDGRTLAAGGFLDSNDLGAARIRVWETATGQERIAIRFVRPGSPVLTDDKVLSVQFTADGRKLVLGAGTAIYLWDLHRGREIRQFTGPQIYVRTLAVSPDAELLAAGTLDGSIRLWRMNSGEFIGELAAHKQTVTALAFSPDGRSLASASVDTTVLLWDMNTIVREAGPKMPASAQLVRWWEDLCGTDGIKANQAVGMFLAQPESAVAFLQGKLRPVSTPERARIQRLIADLDDGRYVVREKAMRELQNLDVLARPELKHALVNAASAEVRRRLERIMSAFEEAPATAELRSAMRAIEVLEGIGNAPARRLLERLARGAPGHRITEESRMALRRLSARARISIGQNK
jgi:WD40 repeat protein